MYLSSLRVAAASAADAARTDDVAKYEAATVFVTVTSQVALRPSRQKLLTIINNNNYYFYYFCIHSIIF